jgi:arsenite oxidase small subunit
VVRHARGVRAHPQWGAPRGLAVRQPVRHHQGREIIADADLPEGGVHLFRYPTAKDPAILLRLPDGELRAFSQKCTHLGCVVYYEQEHRQLVCPCHEGFFDDADGSVIHGPPTRDLPVIPVEVGDDGMIWALGGGGH